MKPIRVNVDYESELFHGGPGPKILNESIEFLAFFLEERPVYTQKVYAESYLDHVKAISGRAPVTTSQGPYENWWGPLENLEAERWLNSKITSALLTIKEKWCPWTRIITNVKELTELDSQKTYILKDPFGMSGSKVQVHRPGIQVKFPVVAEPFFKRMYDFGTYVFPDGKIIYYENLVNDKFQYKGTVFTDWKNPSIPNLSFYSKLKSVDWAKFAQELKVILDHYQKYPNRAGFSVDSFVYEEQGELKIRTLCELNYRRTMGRTAFEFSQKYAGSNRSSRFEFAKSEQRSSILLSPGDTRFDMSLTFF